MFQFFAILGIILITISFFLGGIDGAFTGFVISLLGVFITLLFGGILFFIDEIKKWKQKKAVAE